MKKETIKKIVLAYSGGLDTSVIIPWLKENYNDPEIIAVAADVGQGDELEGLEEKAIKTGASKLIVADLTDEMCDDIIVPSIMMGAKYEKYLLGTAFARPIIAKKLAEIALAEGADAIAHGCTGKGNDQVRFELGIQYFAPGMTIIAPWREWEIKSRDEEIDYAEAHHVPLKISRETNYSKDKNLWHLSHEGLDLEDPANEPDLDKDKFLEMSVSPYKAPDAATEVSVDFEAGVPVAVNGEKMKVSKIIAKLNELGGANGIGILDIVENRLIGMKDHGIYETPGGTILYFAHEQLEMLTLDKETRTHEVEACRRLCGPHLQRQVVQPARRGAHRLCQEGQRELHRHGQAQALQGQHDQRRHHLPQLPVFRRARHLRRERLRSGAGRGLHQHLGSADQGSVFAEEW